MEQYKNLPSRDSLAAVTQNSVGVPLDNENAKGVKVPDMQSEVEKLVENDLNAIRSLMGIGAVSREQGQNLMKQVIQNAYTDITKQHEVQAPSPMAEPAVGQDAFAEFALSQPDFFNRTGREDVLSYLKNSNTKFDKDELLQISKLVEAVEQNAVDRYLKKLEYGKTLNDENLIAKQRLTANAQRPNVADNNTVFTRSQIGKMSGDEFAKYEPQIMDQLRKGLIR